MTFSIAFVAGITPTKWTRIWAERRPDVPLEVFRTNPTEQTAVLHDGRANVSLVRLPIDQRELSVIALYNEIPVVVAATGHSIEASETVAVTDLSDEHLLQNPDDVPEWRDLATEVRDGTRRPLPQMRDMDDTMELVAGGVGIVIVPHSIARLYGRKDVVSRPVGGVPESQIALAWLAAGTTGEVEEFIGIVRGRSSTSSRATPTAAGAAADKPIRKAKKTDKAKAAAKAVRAAAAQAKPAARKSHDTAPGRTRPTKSPKNGKRRGGR